MSLNVGDRIPPVTLHHMTEKGPREISTDELFGGKKVVLLAVPGAFTPTCSAAHLPGFVVKADEIKAKGVRTPMFDIPYQLFTERLEERGIVIDVKEEPMD